MAEPTPTIDPPWRLLVIDDDEVDGLAVRRALALAPVARLDELADPAGLTHEAATTYDCLIIDQRLPGTTGLELVGALRAAGVATPVLVMSGQTTDDVERDIITAGATDYLPKEDLSPDRLVRRVRYAIRVGRAEAASAAAIRGAREAAQARDEMLAIVSHDLRGPLSAIAIAADSLVDEDSRDGRVRMAGAIRRGVDRAEKLIRDLLEVSRIEAGRLEVQPRPVPALSLLQQAMRDHDLVTREAGITVTIAVAEPSPLVRADRDRVAQVLANLISNAVKYARAGGAIALAAEVDGEHVAFSVIDRGPGIAADALPHLFDRYWQGRKQRRGSAGLGLAIAKGIVEAHGGVIRATSTPGDGARFVFTLPSATP